MQVETKKNAEGIIRRKWYGRGSAQGVMMLSMRVVRLTNFTLVFFFNVLMLTLTSGTEFLIGFPCSHVFHLPCLLRYEDEDTELPEILSSFTPFDENPDGSYDRSIGPKVDHAALLRTVVGGGCPVPMHHVDEQV